jgi:hypothetical protein
MSESIAMVNAVLIPPDTLLTQKGDSPAVEIASSDSRVFLLDLRITQIVEQEYVELWLMGSPDGTTWAAQPLATLPQRFYVGEYPTLIDLSQDLGTRFVRVHWELSRWGRGELTPRLQCGLTLREVPPALLDETRAEVHSRRS